MYIIKKEITFILLFWLLQLLSCMAMSNIVLENLIKDEEETTSQKQVQETKDKKSTTKLQEQKAKDESIDDYWKNRSSSLFIGASVKLSYVDRNTHLKKIENELVRNKNFIAFTPYYYPIPNVTGGNFNTSYLMWTFKFMYGVTTFETIDEPRKSYNSKTFNSSFELSYHYPIAKFLSFGLGTGIGHIWFEKIERIEDDRSISYIPLKLPIFINFSKDVMLVPEYNRDYYFSGNSANTFSLSLSVWFPSKSKRK